MNSPKVAWGGLYWSFNCSNYRAGEEFGYFNFSENPIWFIKDASRALKQNRNMDSYAIALSLQTYVNANREEGKPPLDDISSFLPHPLEFKLATRNQQVQCSARAAKAFLDSMDDLPLNVIALFDNWIGDLELISSDY